MNACIALFSLSIDLFLSPRLDISLRIAVSTISVYPQSFHIFSPDQIGSVRLFNDIRRLSSCLSGC